MNDNDGLMRPIPILANGRSDTGQAAFQMGTAQNVSDLQFRPVLFGTDIPDPTAIGYDDWPDENIPPMDFDVRTDYPALNPNLVRALTVFAIVLIMALALYSIVWGA